jgi:hypothetical protein
MMKTMCLMVGLLAVLLPISFAHANESGTMIKADVLKAEPFRDAKTTGSLSVGDQVVILKKNGGWLNVKSAKGSGWVRMLSIRRGASGKSSASVTGLAGLASGRAGTGKVIAATGIRGLGEEELKAAKYDEAQVQQTESFSTSRDEAQQFARKGKLKVQQVDYLKPPNAQPPGAPGNNSGVTK